MNFAIILAGGVGSRMGQKIPKQYIYIEGKPVIAYTLERFQDCHEIDHIVIVADKQWRPDITFWLNEYKIDKFLCFADSGISRQESVFSGLTACKLYAKNDQDLVLVHEAARPLVTNSMILSIIHGLNGYDASIPVLPLNDAVIYSSDSMQLNNLIDRNKLFRGQAPECFRLLPYWHINHITPREDLAHMRADHELAFMHGWNIHLCPGDENNFKLTTPSDIDRMVSLIRTGKV